jgi:uncharacterized protein YbjT (DUF2867 family)
MILLAGGTGCLGAFLTRRLVEKGARVRILTRRAKPKLPVESDLVEAVRGDVRDPASLAAAMSGIHTVVSAIHGFVSDDGGSPESIDRQGNFNLIDAATAVNAEFVLTSIVGASSSSPVSLFRAKYEAEERLRSSGLRWTIVRATAFVETWTMVMGLPLRDKGATMVFGRGENAISFVSADDVAALLAEVARDPSARERILEIGGENLSFNQLASILRTVVGGGTVRHVPRAVMRTMAPVASLFSAQVARQMRTALAMDTDPMGFDGTEAREAYPAVPRTETATAIARYFETHPPALSLRHLASHAVPPAVSMPSDTSPGKITSFSVETKMSILLPRESSPCARSTSFSGSRSGTNRSSGMPAMSIPSRCRERNSPRPFFRSAARCAHPRRP